MIFSLSFCFFWNLRHKCDKKETKKVVDTSNLWHKAFVPCFCNISEVRSVCVNVGLFVWKVGCPVSKATMFKGFSPFLWGFYSNLWDFRISCSSSTNTLNLYSKHFLHVWSWKLLPSNYIFLCILLYFYCVNIYFSKRSNHSSIIFLLSCIFSQPSSAISSYLGGELIERVEYPGGPKN